MTKESDVIDIKQFYFTFYYFDSKQGDGATDCIMIIIIIFLLH